MQRRLAHLPRHIGAAPAWLFGRMWKLAGAITMAVVDAYPVLPSEVNLPRLEKIVRTVDARFLRDFQTLLGSPGVGRPQSAVYRSWPS